MAFDIGNDLTELQRTILNLHDRNPDMGAKEIASRAGCSESYARETIDEHRGGMFGL